MLVTLVPLVLAFVMYFQQLWLPTSTTNEGRLLLPPEEMLDVKLSFQDAAQQEAVDKQWRLLIHTGGDCDPSCLNNLHMIRQLHIALGKEAYRVTRIALLDDLADQKQLFDDYPHMVIARLIDPSMLTQGKGVYLVDPLDNIMMYYTFDQVGKPILKDVKKLLKNSNIG
ncbi:MAG TPA: hypothetical protein DE179_10560 [Oceanospirillaceae bacterium]|nr:hypothetical protein [Oceanospirillaceae bacterium]